MAERRLIQVDVFTRERFGGNQLAVVLDAEGLSTEEMQAIAREMNYSETTFVLPTELPGALCRVRVFTPATELPFAGHPVVGTTWVLAREGRIPLTPLADYAILSPAERSVNTLVAPGVSAAGHATLDLNVGPLAVEALGAAPNHPGFVWMDQPVPESRPWTGDQAGLLSALNLTTNDLHSDLPITWASAGVPYVYVLVRSRAAVARAEPQARLREVLAQSDEGEAGVYVFSLEAGPETAAHGRMFAPHLGVLEDAATGSAAGPLGVVLVRGGIVEPQDSGVGDGTRIVALPAEQGVEMGRPSQITIAVTTRNSTIERVRVGGPSVLVAEGILLTDD